jgi:hypothetical protein
MRGKVGVEPGCSWSQEWKRSRRRRHLRRDRSIGIGQVLIGFCLHWVYVGLPVATDSDHDRIASVDDSDGVTSRSKKPTSTRLDVDALDYFRDLSDEISIA